MAAVWVSVKNVIDMQLATLDDPNKKIRDGSGKEGEVELINPQYQREFMVRFEAYSTQ